MWESLIDRQLGFRMFTPELMAQVRRAKVLLIGTGGNGAVADLLVRSGFEHFALLDSDTVEATNLNRLPFSVEAIGQYKVRAWETHLKAINPDCEVRAWAKPLTRHDGEWLTGVLSGEGWAEPQSPVDLVFLGTTDAEANLVAGRICGEAGVRTLIGPASSGSWIVSTFTHDNGVTLERAGKFGTEGTPLELIDYTALVPKYLQALNYPGRADKLQPGIGMAMMRGTLPARSCGMFVRLTNAAMAFEAIKNIAELRGLPVEGSEVVRMPVVQIFDPYTGCGYLFNAETGALGVPERVDSVIRWHERDGSLWTAPLHI